MKKYLLIFAFAIICISGCKKTDFILPDVPFSNLSAELIQSDAAWADVIPENNDFYYLFAYLPKSIWDQIPEEQWVENIDELARNIYNTLKDEPGVGSFQEECLYKSAWYVPVTDLTPDTEYCLFAFPYDQNIMPVKKVTTCIFKTTKAVVSDIKFDVSVSGPIVTITPSNGDSYFWTYERKETVDKEAISADYYFRSWVSKYWEYGMFPEALSSGEESDDMSKYYNLKDGDQFYLMASGYEGGISSEVFTQVITYKEQ